MVGLRTVGHLVFLPRRRRRRDVDGQRAASQLGEKVKPTNKAVLSSVKSLVNFKRNRTKPESRTKSRLNQNLKVCERNKFNTKH